jgi:hypothetical protein
MIRATPLQEAGMASFKETFAKERKRLGKGKTFMWNGKSYTTNYAEEESSAPKSSPRPKAKPKDSLSGASRSAEGKVKPKDSLSGASRSSEGKVKPKAETPVPGRAIVRAIKNAFTGSGETDAAKIASGRGTPKTKTPSSDSSEKLKNPRAAQARRSAVKSGMTLRERNQP